MRKSSRDLRNQSLKQHDYSRKQKNTVPTESYVEPLKMLLIKKGTVNLSITECAMRMKSWSQLRQCDFQIQ